MKKGFTLIELIIVVIVIGILATFAVPQYMKAVEKAKWAKAKNNLALLSRAEKMYRADNDTYTGFGDAPAATFAEQMELVDVDGDDDWTYAETVASTTVFNATATRDDGPYVGAVIGLDQDGTWAGNLEPGQ